MAEIQQSDIQELQRRLEHYCHDVREQERDHTIQTQDHQMEAHRAVADALKKIQKPEDFWSLMVMATGSGKSFTAGKEIKAFNTPVGARQPTWNYKALIVTSRLSLTNQFKKDLAKNVGISEKDIGIFSGEARCISELEKPVLIVPYPTFISRSKAGKLTPENRPLLILDEVHNATGFEAAQQIRQKWLGKAYIQCWTATDKLSKKTVAQTLFDAHTDRDKDDATYRLTLKQACERGITAPLKSMVLETEFKSGETPNDKGKFSSKAEKRIAAQIGRPEALVKLCSGHYTEKFGIDFRGMRTLLYAPGIEHGKELAKKFNEVLGEGYALAVNGKETKHSEWNPDLEDSIAYRFNRSDRSKGDPKILIYDKLLEEGVDLPQAELSVEEVPTFSEKVETQRVGRVVRKLDGKAAYSVVMLDKDQTGAAIIGEMEEWELKPQKFEFPVAATPSANSLPKLPENYPNINVHVVASAKEIAEFRAGKVAEVRKYRPNDGYLRPIEFGELIQAKCPKITNPKAVANNIIDYIITQLDESDIAFYKKIPITEEAIDSYQHAGKTAHALRKQECDAIVEKYAIIKDSPKKGFLRTVEFGRLIQKANPKHTNPKSIGGNNMSAIRRQLKENDVAICKGVPIPKIALDEYEDAGVPAYALRKKECIEIANKYKESIKDQPKEGFLRGEDLGKLIQKSEPSINPAKTGSAIILNLINQLKHSNIAFFKKVPVTIEAIDKYTYNDKIVYALREQECMAIANKCAQWYTSRAQRRSFPTPQVSDPQASGYQRKNAIG